MEAEKGMHPANHKTIFVLDHSTSFGNDCEIMIEFDFTKSRSPGFIPLAPIGKSIWTCCVEATIEYCRIVWDLFPLNKLVRIVVSDSKAHFLNNWTNSQQSIHQILHTFASVGLPPSPTELDDITILHGLVGAVQALSECTEQQHEYRTSLNESHPAVVNNCRMIVITAIHNIDEVALLEDQIAAEISKQNKIARASDILIPVDHCELVIMNLNTALVPCIPRHRVCGFLSSEMYSVKAAGGLPNRLCCLIMKHYNLASTTVTGIPMKEEQNASCSANYDVEILHPAEAHETLFKGCNVNMDMVRTLKEGCGYDTVTLKWCTPRGCSDTEMQHSTMMHRITPVDINSRPSSCLINFLINGRSVMLEVVTKRGTKALSHLLAAHGINQIYMHSLPIGKSTLDDPPSISEGPGGRVTDYRITDFGSFMKQNKLLPLKAIPSLITPKRIRTRLDRCTKYWPLTISSTVIFNYRQHLEPILSLMMQPELRESDVSQCKQCIYSLINLEAKHESLNSSPGSGQRSKGPKREEQYKQMWIELETFLRAHCMTDRHINILNYLLEMRSKSSSLSSAISSVDYDNVELDQALRELDQLPALDVVPAVKRLKEERASVIRATTDSPLSPDDVHSHSIEKASSDSNTLLTLWLNKFYKVKNRPDFQGLAYAEHLPNGNLKAKLYGNLKEKRKVKSSIEV